MDGPLPEVVIEHWVHKIKHLLDHLLHRSPFGSKRFFKARAFYWFVFYSVVFPRYFIVLLIQISGYLLMRRLWRGLANFPIRSWSHNNLKQTKIIYNFIYVDKKLACSTSKVFAIRSYIYMLFSPTLIWRFFFGKEKFRWLSSENKGDDTKTEHRNLDFGGIICVSMKMQIFMFLESIQLINFSSSQKLSNECRSK